MGVAKRLSSGCSDDSDPSSLTAEKKGEEDQGWIVSEFFISRGEGD